MYLDLVHEVHSFVSEIQDRMTKILVAEEIQEVFDLLRIFLQNS